MSEEDIPISREDGYAMIIRNLAKSDYRSEEVRRALELNLIDTLNALAWAVETRKINTKDEAGRRILRTSIGYLFEEGMLGQLQDFEGKLYQMCSPVRKEICDDNSVALGLFWMSGTLGTVDWVTVAEKRKQRKYHEFAMKMLCP